MPSVAEDLKRVPLFSGLSQRQLRQLVKDFSERRVPVGTLLVKQGEMSGVAFFVIAEGEAAVIVDGARVATLGPGDYFGELAMISSTRAHRHGRGADAGALPHDPILGFQGVREEES